MKTDKTGLGDRMKGYENVTRNHLIRRMPVVMRLDGCHFHTVCKHFDKPFDMVMVKAMQDTMKYLCENIQGCVLGYTQSDEITLVLVDYQNLNTDSWFDSNIQKMVSVSASMASWAFRRAMENYMYMTPNANPEVYEKAMDKGAFFDCRVFNLPKEEVTNNLLWRELDSIRNSKQAFGQAYFSQKELHKKNVDEIVEMVKEKMNLNWEHIPDKLQRGSCCVKGDDGKWYVDQCIPIFKGDGRDYIEKLINVGE